MPFGVLPNNGKGLKLRSRHAKEATFTIKLAVKEK
jgi:hypothetical protein